MLTGPGILAEIKAGRLVVEPFDPACVNPNSYDVKLSPELLIYERRELRVGVDNPTLPLLVPAEGLRLLPGQLYLARTVEWTETHPPWMPRLEGKSSLGRLGISVHATAGFGDVGFKGHWTLEISVVQPVIILPHIRIAQVCYFRTEGPVQLYDGRYQDQHNVEPYRPDVDKPRQPVADVDVPRRRAPVTSDPDPSVG